MFRTRLLEPAPGIANGMKHLPSALGVRPVTAAVVAGIFGCSGPPLILIGAAEAGGLSDGQAVAWLLSSCLLGGIISVIMALYYKMPIVGAWSIPGAVMVAASLDQFAFGEAVGAFILSGLVVFLLGISGLIGRVMRWLPMPIVMAMIAGAMVRFATGAVSALSDLPLVVGGAVLAYFIGMRYIRAVPPVLLALVVGLAVAMATGAIGANERAADIAFIAPEFTAPVFTLEAFLAISLPLALLVIGAENAQATGVLITEGYRPPVNAMTIVSGIGGMIAGLLGAHNANIAGPMTAICASEQAGEDTEKRYAAALVNGLIFGTFGIVAGVAVPVVLMLPSALISVIAGLAMIGVLLSALQGAFDKGRHHQTGAFVALAVAMSGVSFLGISAPFWALVAGCAVSFMADRAQQEEAAPAGAARRPAYEDA